MARRTSSLALWLAVALATIGGADHSSTLVRLVARLDPAASATLATAGTDAMATTVAATLAGILGVTPPPYIVLRVYDSRPALQHGLVRHLGVPWRVADEVSGFATGVALRRSVTLLADGAADDRLRLMGHELTHVLQFELGGPAARPAQWLMEGSAEWAAFEVMEQLGDGAVEARREVARRAMRDYLLHAVAFDPVSIERSADFIRWQHRVGSVLAYQVAFGLADALVDRSGVAGVVQYFRALAGGADHPSAFARAFAITPGALVAEARRGIEPPPIQTAAPARRAA